MGINNKPCRVMTSSAGTPEASRRCKLACFCSVVAAFFCILSIIIVTAANSTPYQYDEFFRTNIQFQRNIGIVLMVMAGILFTVSFILVVAILAVCSCNSAADTEKPIRDPERAVGVGVPVVSKTNPDSRPTTRPKAPTPHVSTIGRGPETIPGSTRQVTHRLPRQRQKAVRTRPNVTYHKIDEKAHRKVEEDEDEEEYGDVTPYPPESEMSEIHEEVQEVQVVSTTTTCSRRKSPSGRRPTQRSKPDARAQQFASRQSMSSNDSDRRRAPERGTKVIVKKITQRRERDKLGYRRDHLHKKRGDKLSRKLQVHIFTTHK